MKIKMISKLVFQEALVGVFDVLWQITEKRKLRLWRWELCYEFDLNILALVSWRRKTLNYRQQYIIELTGLYLFASVLVNRDRSLYGLVDTLFC